jgi:hypothetical protein
VSNAKCPGLLKLSVRDASYTSQCLVFWNCLKRDDVQIGSTYRLTVLSTAVVKAGGLAKKKAASDAKHYASYGDFVISFGTPAEFIWQLAPSTDSLPEVPAHVGCITPTDALLSPVGVAAVLLDVTGAVLSSLGRRDAQGRPYCEATLFDKERTIRVTQAD